MSNDDLEAGGEQSPPRGYEPPKVQAVGSLSQLTQGPPLGGSDFTGAGSLTFS